MEKLAAMTNAFDDLMRDVGTLRRFRIAAGSNQHVPGIWHDSVWLCMIFHGGMVYMYMYTYVLCKEVYGSSIMAVYGNVRQCTV